MSEENRSTHKLYEKEKIGEVQIADEVAAIVGYNNPLYFSRLFKKQTGLPPSEFRNNKI